MASGGAGRGAREVEGARDVELERGREILVADSVWLTYVVLGVLFVLVGKRLEARARGESLFIHIELVTGAREEEPAPRVLGAEPHVLAVVVGMIQLNGGGEAVLLVLVLCLFVTARLLARQRTGPSRFRGKK